MKKTKFKLLLILLLPLLFFLSGCPDNPEAPAGTNNLPIGSAGIGKTVLVGETVTIEGTASDPDEGTTLSYQWTITSVPAGSAITGASISSPTTLNASFTPDLPGIYTVQLTVNDGVDTASFEADIRVVGFAIGLNDNTNSHSAYIHNGEFYPHINPAPSVDICGQTDLRLINSTVYSAGYFFYTADNTQPVYWNGTSPTPVISPPIDYPSFFATQLAVKSPTDVQLIIREFSHEAPGYNFWDNNQYIAPEEAVIAVPAWGNYIITELFQSGTDIFQAGYTTDETAKDPFFLAKNRTEIIHEAAFNPNPMDGSFDNVRGSLFLRGATDSEAKVCIYGSNQHTDGIINSGYVINDSGWTDLTEGVSTDYGSEYVSFMSSTSDYIIVSAPNIGTPVFLIFVNNSEYSMEIPIPVDEDGEISDIHYVYMEEIGGSIFVAGGYYYSHNPSETYYNTAVIWRDGVIVAEEYDNDFTDEDDYDLASIIAADFE